MKIVSSSPSCIDIDRQKKRKQASLVPPLRANEDYLYFSKGKGRLTRHRKQTKTTTHVGGHMGQTEQTIKL